MSEWTVTVALDATGPVTDSVLEDLAAIGGAAAGEPCSSRVETVLTVDAPDPAAAVRLALEVVTGVVAGDVVAIEVTTPDEADSRLAQAPFPELAGVSEIAEDLGVTRQRVNRLQSSSTFPAPVAVLASGPVWRRADISRFADRWVRRSGRPPKIDPVRRIVEKGDDVAAILVKPLAGHHELGTVGIEWKWTAEVETLGAMRIALARDIAQQIGLTEIEKTLTDVTRWYRKTEALVEESTRRGQRKGPAGRRRA